MGFLKAALPDRVGWIVGLGTCLGMASQSAGFWIVGALVRTGGLDIQQAALMSMAEMVTSGTVMLLIAPSIHRWPHKASMAAAFILALVAQASSAALAGFLPLLCSRIVSGVAFGVIYAIASAVGAGADDPKKAYAATGSILLTCSTPLNPALGFASERFGHVGVFIALSLFCTALAIPLMLLKFDPPKPAVAVAAATTSEMRARWLLAACVVAIMGLFAISTNGTFIVIEHVAERVGLRGTVLGNSLMLVSFAGAVGVVLLQRLTEGANRILSERLSVELGRSVRFAIALLAIGTCSLGLVDSGSPVSFYIWITLWTIIYWFAYTHIFALSVVADPLGRLAAATGSILILLGGAGSAVAGYTLAHFDLVSFGMLAFASCLFAGLMGAACVRATRAENLT